MDTSTAENRFAAIRNINQLMSREQNRDRPIESASRKLIESKGDDSARIVLIGNQGKPVQATPAGRGLPPEDSSSFFGAFSTGKEKGKKTRGELSTGYGIVRQCGGHIEAASPPGGGTTFRVHFPARVKSAPGG